MYPLHPRPSDPQETDVEETEVRGDALLADPVLRHRANKMERAGLNTRQARALALDRSVDSHDVVKALSRGCAPDLAFYIFS